MRVKKIIYNVSNYFLIKRLKNKITTLETQQFFSTLRITYDGPCTKLLSIKKH